METELAKMILLTVLLCGFVFMSSYLFQLLVLRPKSIRSKLEKQGIRGPRPTFLLGNIPEMMRLQRMQHGQSTPTSSTDHDHTEANSISHQWHLKLFPHIQQWRNEYGPIFLCSAAHIQQLQVTDMEMVKEFILFKSTVLGNPSITSKALGSLLGEGILSSNGSRWEHQKKIIAPELYLDKVKGMMNLMVDSTTSMIRTWQNEVQMQGGLAEIRVDDHIRNLSADVISKAFCNSNYGQGEEIFSKIRKLQIILAKGLMGIEGLTRWFPTAENIKIWRLEKEIESLILKVANERSEGLYVRDLLQMLLEGAKSSDDLSGLSQKKFIVDNCKTMFFAGHETTSLVASWTLLLLALHPDWQARARAEVLEICGEKPLDADMLRHMKVLTMVIQEVLRLYPPVFYITREAFETITFKNIMIPKGTLLQIPIPFLHQNTDLWGLDAHKFNPERFENGFIKACKSPQAYMPFGAGSRVCIGQHLAMTELKVVLSMFLLNFCFSPSPAYQHSPVYKIFTEPEHGIILQIWKASP